MILHLGDDVSVHSADIVAIIDLTQSQNPVTGAMLAEIRRQNRNGNGAEVSRRPHGDACQHHVGQRSHQLQKPQHDFQTASPHDASSFPKHSSICWAVNMAA